MFSAVADPEFPRGERIPGGGMRQPISSILQIFCQKLNENERIWNEREGRASSLDLTLLCLRLV